MQYGYGSSSKRDCLARTYRLGKYKQVFTFSIGYSKYSIVGFYSCNNLNIIAQGYKPFKYRPVKTG